MFDWQKYLELAQALAGHPDDEASWRSATSRAYYAAYHRARSRLPEGILGRMRDGQSHAEVWDFFRNASEKIPRSIGINGDRLKQMRVNADYRSREQHRQVDAKTAIELACRIVKQLEEVQQLTQRHA